MFNGIIYNQGTVTKIIKRPKGLNIFVKSNFNLSNKDIGLSVACDGVCLTLISYRSKIMEFYIFIQIIKSLNNLSSSEYGLYEPSSYHCFISVHGTVVHGYIFN